MTDEVRADGATLTEHTIFRYGLNDTPPWIHCLVYALQWLLIFLPTLTVLSVISSQYLHLDRAAEVLFFQRILLMTGGAIILQTLVGHRYPLLDGPASALLLSFIILAPGDAAAVQGGMMVGGVLLLLLGSSGLLRHVRPLFTDTVVGVILILIATTLLPYLIPSIVGQGQDFPAGDPLIFGIACTVMLIIAILSHWCTGFPQTISLFLGILFGTLIMAALGRLEAPGVSESPWFSWPWPVTAGLPRFSCSITLTFVLAYLAVLINGVGSIYSLGEVVGRTHMTQRLGRGISVTGIAGIAAGFLGVFGTVSYAMSPGVILVTRVSSRIPVTVCGIMLVGLAFFQKILAFLASIPPAVVAAALVTGLAAQLGAGISILTRSGRGLASRDYLVAGLPILLGSVVSIVPEAFFQSFPASVQALTKNGLIVGIVMVLALEHLVLRPRRQR